MIMMAVSFGVGLVTLLGMAFESGWRHLNYCRSMLQLGADIVGPKPRGLQEKGLHKIWPALNAEFIETGI